MLKNLMVGSFSGGGRREVLTWLFSCDFHFCMLPSFIHHIIHSSHIHHIHSPHYWLVIFTFACCLNSLRYWLFSCDFHFCMLPSHVFSCHNQTVGKMRQSLIMWIFFTMEKLLALSQVKYFFFAKKVRQNLG